MSVFIEEGVIKLLTADSAVSALVGNRVHHLTAPQNAELPYVLVTRISAPRANDMSGPSGWIFASIQIDAWAKTSAIVKDLAEKIRDALSGYTGTVTTASGDITIDWCALESDTDGFEMLPGQDVGIKRVSQDYEVTVQESIPTFA